jgi:hypothetical protein
MYTLVIYFCLQRNSFEIHWDKYVGLDMGFENNEFVYLVVPEQSQENT